MFSGALSILSECVFSENCLCLWIYHAHVNPVVKVFVTFPRFGVEVCSLMFLQILGSFKTL